MFIYDKRSPASTTADQSALTAHRLLISMAQLRRAHPLLRFQTIRGNLNTRLSKVDNADDYDALILARAGIDRMGWQDRVDEMLDSDVCLYAVGQV